MYNPWFAFGLFMLQIRLLVALTAAVTRLSTGAALLMFLFYSALTGVSLSAIFIYYSQSTKNGLYFLAGSGDVFLRGLLGFFIKGEMSGAGPLPEMLSLLGWLLGSKCWSCSSRFFTGLHQAMNFTGAPSLRG